MLFFKSDEVKVWVVVALFLVLCLGIVKRESLARYEGWIPSSSFRPDAVR
jgi:hypothetical protein